MRALWLLTVIVLAWQNMDPVYLIEVQRKTGRGAWTTIATTTGHATEDTVPRGRHCWRVRYHHSGAPQTSQWTNQACVRVP